MIIPPVLYKFAPDARFLENGLFRFSQPDALNDPQEAQPRIVFQEYAPDDYAIARATSTFDLPQQELEAMCMNPYPGRRFDEKGFPGLWPAQESRLREEPFKTIEEYDRAVIDKAVFLCRKVANDNFGVFCMTESTEDHLWSHYAKDHKGVAVTFNARHPFFSASGAIFRIEYSDESISVSSNHGIVRIAGHRVRQEDILEEQINVIPLELLTRKRLSWAHEKEWRMIKPLSEGLCTEKNDSNNLPVFLFEIPPECVQTVTFGYKVCESDIAKAQDFIKISDKWGHIKLRQRKRLLNGAMEEIDINF